MAHVPVQKEPDGKPAKAQKAVPVAPEPSAPASELVKPWLHPLQTMREWLQADPFAWMVPLHPFRGRGALYVPDFDVKETEEGFVFKADVPGIQASEIDVKLVNNRLTVSGHREEEKSKKGETFFAYERSYGSFSRSFVLPEGADADKIDADLRDGVLTITVKKLPGAEPKHVPVKPAS
jgi:HSP20 family protein